MRMWMVVPEVLCRQHLLGEHNENHKFVGAILHGQLESGRLSGYINGNYLEVKKLRFRHRLLVREMRRRGYNHKSPLPRFPVEDIGIVDIDRAYEDLYDRCATCKKRIIAMLTLLLPRRNRSWLVKQQ